MFETKARKERHVNDVHYGASKVDCPQCGARVERYYWWDFLPDIFSQVLSSPALCACPYGTFPSQSNVELVRHVRLNSRLLLHTRCSRTDGGFAGVHPPPVWIHQSNQMVTHNRMFWECIQSNICFFSSVVMPEAPEAMPGSTRVTAEIEITFFLLDQDGTRALLAALLVCERVDPME